MAFAAVVSGLRELKETESQPRRGATRIDQGGGRKKQLRRWALKFGAGYGGWQKPAEAKDLCLRRVRSVALLS